MEETRRHHYQHIHFLLSQPLLCLLLHSFLTECIYVYNSAEYRGSVLIDHEYS